MESLKCLVVAFVKCNELAVGRNHVDEPVEHGEPRLHRDRSFSELRYPVRTDLVQALMQRHEDVVLRGEVVIEGGLRKSQLFGDLSQRCLVEALLDEEVEGDVENPLPRALALQLVGIFGHARGGPGSVAGLHCR